MTDTSYTLHSPHCPQPSQWLRYRRGLSSAEETRAIEEHFTDCPLCSEAIEYIMNTPANELEQAWEQLPSPHLEKENIPTTPPFQLKRFLTPISVAASVALLFGGAYFLYQASTQEKPKPLAQLSEGAKPSNATTPINPNTETANPVNTVLENSATASTKQQEIPALATAPTKAVKPAPIASMDKKEADMSISEQHIEYTTPMANAAPAMALSANETAAPAMEEKDMVNTVATAKPLAKTRSIELSRDMKTESDKMSAVKTLAENNTPSGIEYYHQQQYRKAIPLLEIALKANPQNEELHWYLGDAYAQIGRIKQAMEHLQIVAQGNSTYKKQAQQTLDLLEKK